MDPRNHNHSGGVPQDAMSVRVVASNENTQAPAVQVRRYEDLHLGVSCVG